MLCYHNNYNEVNAIMTMKVPLFVWLLATLLCPRTSSGQTDAELRQLIDNFVNAIQQCNNIPGINLSVVRNGQVFHTAAYGVKDLVSLEPMTGTTLVNIASITKHFVSTTMAKVLENSAGTWDFNSRIRDILGPSFYMSDGYMTEHMTITDLLCHRVGLARHDMVRSAGWSLDDMVSQLRHLESSEEFRDRHQYNNLMLNLADKVIQTISGRASWEDILQESFLDPLNMTSTTFVTREQFWPQYATSYLLDGGSPREVSLEAIKVDYGISTAPGGIATNTEDMAKWTTFQLSGGQAPNGTQLVDSNLLAATHDHCAVSGEPSLYEYPEDPVTYNRESKGMGWFEGFYREYYLSGHSGSKAGFQSLYTLLPGVNLGICCTVTGPNTDERDFITMYVADVLLNKTAWLDPDTVCSVVEPAVGQSWRNTNNWRQVKGSDVDIMAYTGTFGHFGYGNVTFVTNNVTGALEMEYGFGNPQVRWSLEQLSDTDFAAVGLDDFWFHSHDVVFEDVGGGNYDRVVIDFDSDVPATFVRDLDIADSPPPPQLCQ